MIGNSQDFLDDTWRHVDFQVNKMFWRHWGADAALPFRVQNLVDLSYVADRSGLVPIVVGRGARHVISFGELREDHDDDVAFACSVDESYELLSRDLHATGFRTIRKTSEIWSVLRFDRYIDIHGGFGGETSSRRAHGYKFEIGKEISKEDSKEIRESRLDRTLSRFRRAIRSPRTTLIKFLESVPSTPENDGEWVGFVQLDDFLSLRFDFDTAINWEWRHRHIENFAWPGATVGQILDRLDLDQLRASLQETPMKLPYTEPINLSRSFWGCGNNFFVAPMLAGFRHCVLPYSAANLYIRSGLEPELYSIDYYRALPKVEDEELASFLSRRPIAIKKGSVRSGRHRVATMIGRLAMGLPYVPFYAEAET